VIAETYAEDVVWHEEGRVIRGREALARRAAELRAQTPDWVFQPYTFVNESSQEAG